jgi:hypothetical protein
LKIVNPRVFKQHMQELRITARNKLKLLKERDLVISAEAAQLLSELEEEETDHLYSKLKRKGKRGKQCG